MSFSAGRRASARPGRARNGGRRSLEGTWGSFWFASSPYATVEQNRAKPFISITDRRAAGDLSDDGKPLAEALRATPLRHSCSKRPVEQRWGFAQARSLSAAVGAVVPRGLSEGGGYRRARWRAPGAPRRESARQRPPSSCGMGVGHRRQDAAHEFGTVVEGST